MRELIEVQYPQAEKLVLVMDNLNTHSPASFYEVFAPEEAWRLSQKLDIHHTPLHGSWLNMAEIELSVLARQALSGRIPTLQEIQERIATWQERRNHKQATLSWRFTTADARIKLKRLYPSIEARQSTMREEYSYNGKNATSRSAQAHQFTRQSVPFVAYRCSLYRLLSIL
jgi:hypothetical protein